MKMADLLHSIADMLDKQQSDRPSNSIEPGSKILNPEDNPTEHGGAGDAEVGDVMIPPLQQKLELLKKATGVDNAFSDDESEPDELSDIKRLTGITPVIMHLTGDQGEMS